MENRGPLLLLAIAALSLVSNCLCYSNGVLRVTRFVGQPDQFSMRYSAANKPCKDVQASCSTNCTCKCTKKNPTFIYFLRRCVANSKARELLADKLAEDTASYYEGGAKSRGCPPDGLFSFGKKLRRRGFKLCRGQNAVVGNRAVLSQCYVTQMRSLDEALAGNLLSVASTTKHGVEIRNQSLLLKIREQSLIEGSLVAIRIICHGPENDTQRTIRLLAKIAGEREWALTAAPRTSNESPTADGVVISLSVVVTVLVLTVFVSASVYFLLRRRRRREKGTPSKEIGNQLNPTYGRDLIGMTDLPIPGNNSDDNATCQPTSRHNATVHEVYPTHGEPRTDDRMQLPRIPVLCGEEKDSYYQQLLGVTGVAPHEFKGKSTQEDEAPVGPEKLDNPDYEEILEYQVLEEAPTGESQGDSPDKPLSTLLD